MTEPLWSLFEFEVRPYEGQGMSMGFNLLAHRLDGRSPDILVIVPLIRHTYQQAPLYVIDGFLHNPFGDRCAYNWRDGNRRPIGALVAVR